MVNLKKKEKEKDVRVIYKNMYVYHVDDILNVFSSQNKK
jgi:hypothetical protein